VLAPGGAVTDAAAERWPAQARRALAGEFLASPQAAQLRDPIAHTGPHLLAMCCVGHLGCQPVLTGPSVLERVLVDALARAAITPDRFGRAVPQAVRAWADWVAERNKLTDRSRRRLGSACGRRWSGSPARGTGPRRIRCAGTWRTTATRTRAPAAS
jgi:hypothetical protein